MADHPILSNTTFGGVRLTWAVLAKQERERALKAESLVAVIMDLDRCEHGRHEADDCFGCKGRSTGNLLLPPGTVLGHDIDGGPIVLPKWQDLSDPKAWRGVKEGGDDGPTAGR